MWVSDMPLSCVADRFADATVKAARGHSLGGEALAEVSRFEKNKDNVDFRDKA